MSLFRMADDNFTSQESGIGGDGSVGLRAMGSFGLDGVSGACVCAVDCGFGSSDADVCGSVGCDKFFAGGIGGFIPKTRSIKDMDMFGVP